MATNCIAHVMKSPNPSKIVRVNIAEMVILRKVTS